MPTQTTFSGFSQFAKDFWQGWKDTKDEAVNRFNKAVEIDEKQNLDQSVGDPDKVYAGQAPIVGLGGLASVALYPIGFAINKVIPYADKILPYADLSHTGSLLQKEFWTNPNYKYVDHTYDELGAPAMTDVARWVATPAVMKGATKGAKSYVKGVSGRVKAVKEAGERPTAKEVYDSFKGKDGFSRVSSNDNDFRVYAMDPQTFRHFYDVEWTGNHIPSHSLLRYDPKGQVLELHMNPEIIREAWKYLIPVKNGSKIHQYQAVRIMNELPEGTQLSQDANSVSTPAYLAKNGSPWTRGLFYLTGKEPSIKPEITRGYSSSVPDAMFRNAAKGRGTVEKSITTRSGTTNLFGDNSQILREVFKDYITRSEDGIEEINFQNLPKDIIKKWNEKYGEKLHMHIDPKNKTMDNWIYVKGKKNSGRN